jgi:glucose/arabinose dehydrogenase
MTTVRLFFLCCLAMGIGLGSALAEAIPVNATIAKKAPVALSLHQEADGFKQPVFLTHAGDGSGGRFVVEQAGRIIHLSPDGARSTFLDLTRQIKSGGERGLLGLAFHPSYAENGRFFVYYTDRQGDIAIAELNAFPGDNRERADPSSLTVLLSIPNPAINHNGGMLAFGPDGYLYIGTGDGGGAGDPFQSAQNSFSLLGKMLRIDVDGQASGLHYRIPSDNPFTGRTTYRPEIWAKGLRNPWRFSFDSENGNLFIADVGQDHWEEVNFQPAGDKGGTDYGWSHMEGRHCFPPNSKKRCARGERPVAEYSHDDGCSVVGGYVYRGSDIPKLDGVYLFSDYCSGTLWGLTPRKGRSGEFHTKRYLDTNLSVSGFGSDESGSLYLLDHRRGSIHRIVPQGWAPPSTPPSTPPTSKMGTK